MSLREASAIAHMATLKRIPSIHSLWFWFWGLVFLNVADILCTGIEVHVWGSESEGNPFMEPLINVHGMWPVALFKAFSLVALGVIIVKAGRTRISLRGTLVSLVMVFGVLTGYHGLLLYSLRGAL